MVDCSRLFFDKSKMFEKRSHIENNEGNSNSFNGTEDPLSRVHLYSSPISNSEAFYRIISRNNQTKEVDTVEARLSPKTTDKILDRLSPNLRELIFNRWYSSRDIYQLYNGSVLVPLLGNRNYSTGFSITHSLPNVQEIVELSNIQRDRLNGYYTIHTGNNMISFTENEIAFAIRRASISEGITGICRKLAFLNFIHLNSNIRNIIKTLDMIAEMEGSKIVDGAMTYYQRIVDALDIQNRGITIGIESEIFAAYDVFQRIRANNRFVNPSHKRFLHISRELRHTEIDITVFRLNRYNERVPVEMIETKVTYKTLRNKLKRIKGKNQMFNYFKECLKYPCSPYYACPVRIYITEDPRTLFLRSTRQVQNYYDPYQPGVRRGHRFNYIRNVLGEIFYRAKRNRAPDMAIDVQLIIWNDWQKRFEIADSFTLY